MELMQMKSQISYKNQIIGEVYKSSHGVWVAQPNFSNLSQSFLTQEAAEIALIEKYKETI